MVRRSSWASLALGPLVILLHYTTDLGEEAEFVLASLALIPLAWLIGEATEHASHHTGSGIGGFLNATFGNAPELIIALIAVNEGLTEVVRGSLTGSVVGNLLLVLGFSLALGGTRRPRPPVVVHVARARGAGRRRVPHPVDSRLGRRPRSPLAGGHLASRVDRAARPSTSP